MPVLEVTHLDYETTSSTSKLLFCAYALMRCTLRPMHAATIRPLDTAFSGNVKSYANHPRGLAMKNPPSADLLRVLEPVSNADGIDELVNPRLLPSLRIAERKKKN